MEKLAAVRKEMDANGAESLLLSALDEIAWLLNIRGNDVHCNPVVVSYLLIEKNAVHYFIQPQKVTAELTSYFNVNGISVHTYEEIEDYLNHFLQEAYWQIPPKQITPSTRQSIRNAG